MPNLTDEFLEEFEPILEYRYYGLASSHFSYHKHPDPHKPGKFLDNGVCEVCGKKHQYTLIEKDKPTMCYKCYQAIRAYQTLRFDTLKLKKKKVLNVKDCKKIVKYMSTYVKTKALAFKVVGAMILTGLDYASSKKKNR